jgi:hypothetical protein
VHCGGPSDRHSRSPVRSRQRSDQLTGSRPPLWPLFSGSEGSLASAAAKASAARESTNDDSVDVLGHRPPALSQVSATRRDDGAAGRETSPPSYGRCAMVIQANDSTPRACLTRRRTFAGSRKPSSTSGKQRLIEPRTGHEPPPQRRHRTGRQRQRPLPRPGLGRLPQQTPENEEAAGCCQPLVSHTRSAVVSAR